MQTQIRKENPALISFMTLRKAIGWLGLTLPAAMIVGNWIFGSCYYVQDSNSHYYYTITGDLFVGILCAVGLFLFTYKGYDRIDNIASSLAGFFAICIAMFPTNDNSANRCSDIMQLPPNEIRNTIHFASAALFFVILAGMSLFLFTKSKGGKTRRKEIRNSIYRTCGILILVSIAMIGAYALFEEQLSGLGKYHPVFWLEWVALLAFGVSWLVKGEIVLKDKKKIPQEEPFAELMKMKQQSSAGEQAS
jgi:hypothetical protein